MKRTVKVIVRDYPKRTDSFRSTVEVEANTDDEAMKGATAAAHIKWPHGKIIPFDVLPTPKGPPPNVTQRATLKVKAHAA